jgi:hypothetical protein
MLRVTVEIVPFGDETMARRLGGVLIGNTGEGNMRTGHYEVWETLASGGQRRAARRIRRFPRSRGWLPLVFMAFETIARDWKTRTGHRDRFPWKDPQAGTYLPSPEEVYRAAQERHRG